MPLSNIFCAVSIYITFTFAANPYVVEWNTTKSYGPDGPWPVITVQVGSKGEDTLAWIDLHPGSQWGSKLLSSNFCSGTNAPSPCLAKQAGLYDANASSTSITNFTDEGGVIYDWDSNDAYNFSGYSVNVMDAMSVNTAQGVYTASNASITLADSWQIQLPDGTNYSAQVGSLSVGSPGNGFEGWSDVNGNDAPDLSSSSFPGSLLDDGDIESNSFGLHYGSASLGLTGSLVFGGYDQSRVLGDTGVFDLGKDSKMTPSLLDIQIGVESGASPFNSSSFPGLLKVNPTHNGVQPASVNPAVPYLFMSSATCTAIAANLPVTLNSDLGLYTWNTADPQYQKILDSSAYLSFVFQNTGAGNLTIKVPFQLLNLTLEAPIVSTPQPYFPCRPLFTDDSEYVLGRAFLQAAFVGINWQNLKWFMGQAPGPGAGASNIQSLGSKDNSISSDPIDQFATTWAKNWKQPTSNNDTAGTDSSSDDKSSGLSTGAKAGIGIGAAFGALAVLAAAIGFCLYRRKRSVPKEEMRMLDPSQGEYYNKDTPPHVEATTGGYHEKDAQSYQPPPLELGGQSMPHEAAAENEVFEMGVRRGSTEDLNDRRNS